jgi:hypothetical protein
LSRAESVVALAPAKDCSRSWNFTHALGWLALALVLAVLWLALNVLLPVLQATGVASVAIRVTIHGLMLAGLWLGLARTSFAAPARLKVWLALAVPITAWLTVVWWLALTGAFRPRPGVPALPLAIFLPVLLAAPLLLNSKRIGTLLDATPTAWLVGLQVYRVFGGIFLVSWSRGTIPGSFALPAGIGDVLVGVLALPVASLLASGHGDARRLALAWNVLGLLDFAIAISIGILSAPGPLQLIIPEPPNRELGTFPSVMIPAFAVPSSILLHALSLRQLLRCGKQ